MGLAPWHSRWSSAGADDGALGSVGERLGEAAGLPAVMSGSLLDEDGLQTVTVCLFTYSLFTHSATYSLCTYSEVDEVKSTKVTDRKDTLTRRRCKGGAALSRRRRGLGSVAFGSLRAARPARAGRASGASACLPRASMPIRFFSTYDENRT